VHHEEGGVAQPFAVGFSSDRNGARRMSICPCAHLLDGFDDALEVALEVQCPLVQVARGRHERPHGCRWKLRGCGGAAAPRVAAKGCAINAYIYVWTVWSEVGKRRSRIIDAFDSFDVSTCARDPRVGSHCCSTQHLVFPTALRSPRVRGGLTDHALPVVGMEAHRPRSTAPSPPPHDVRDLFRQQPSYSSYTSEHASASASSYGFADDEEEEEEPLLLDTLGRELMAILTPLSLTMLMLAVLVHVLPPDLNGGDKAIARLLTPYYQEQVYVYAPRMTPPNGFASRSSPPTAPCSRTVGADRPSW
jgi:hypothetical protein